MFALQKERSLQAQDGGQGSEFAEELLDQVNDFANIKSGGEISDAGDKAGNLVDERIEVDTNVLTLGQAAEASKVKHTQFDEKVVDSGCDEGDCAFDVDIAGKKTSDESFDGVDVTLQSRNQTSNGDSEFVDQISDWIQVEAKETFAKSSGGNDFADSLRDTIDLKDVDVDVDITFGRLSLNNVSGKR